MTADAVRTALYALAIFVTALVAASAAFRLKTNARVQSLGSVFGGGVFLGAGLLHLLPDSRALNDDYPLAELLASLGFLGLVVVEGFADALINKAQIREHPDESAGIGLIEHRDDPTESSLAEAMDEMGHSVHSLVELPPGSSPALAIVLWLALSIHSFIAGLALGATTATGGFPIFLAIITHKGVAAFALGTSFLRSKSSRARFFVAMVSFSLVTPLGALVGALMVASNVSDGTSQSVLIAVAAGTFIYVATVEIIAKELGGHGHDSRTAKMISLFLGFGSMAIIALWT